MDCSKPSINNSECVPGDGAIKRALESLAQSLERIVLEIVRAAATELAVQPSSTPSNNLLNAREAAKRLGVSTKWIYKHARELRAVKLDGAVRFSAKGLEDYIRNEMEG
jgi:predicted DNA-binding transcriptional regulator AlpA